MPVPFSRTLLALGQDRALVPLVTIALAALTLAGWLGWFRFARLSSYVLSDEARLEVSGAPHVVAAPVGGRVNEVHAEPGRAVVEGEVLFVLESRIEEGRLLEEEARARAALEELSSLRAALANAEAALAASERVAVAALEEARSRQAASVASAELAAEEARLTDQLLAQGLVSVQDARRRRAEATERSKEAEARQLSLARLTSEGEREQQDRQSRVEQLRHELTRRAGEGATFTAAVERARREIEQRQVRAPVAGRLGEVAALRPGSVAVAGERLATVLPESELRIVAAFHANALGRIRRGQAAEVRLEGFPWTQYGSLAAEVVRVESEPREGRLRVEARLLASEESAIPLTHGLPGTLAVVVDRLSPAALVLRAAGQSMNPRPTSAPPPRR